MKKKRLKVKKRIWVVLVLLIFIVIGIVAFIKIRENYLYKQTYEYKFLQLSYTLDEIELLQKNLPNEKLDELLLGDKDSTLVNLMKEQFYKNALLDRYLNYLQSNKASSLKDAINIVNVNRDMDYYTANYKADSTKEYSILVNKYYLLDENFEPNDLVDFPSKYAWGTGNRIRTIVYDAYLNMWNAAYEQGYYLMVNSSYRSYSEQAEVYNDYKEFKGEIYADSIAARPGASEHQTGLALDIFEKTNSSTKTFKDSSAFAWLKDNSYKYGFILRYPEGAEKTTGYSSEAWHYRYVGIELAADIYNKGITLDEYYANYLS